jgi:ceramide glucosyltransferase
MASPHEPKHYGLPAFGRFLAEDNMIASALWHELGLRHDLSCDVVRNVVGNMSLWDYVWRRVRWIRVRKHMVLAATVLEPFTESLMLAFVGSLSCEMLFSTPSWAFFPLHFFIWFLVDLDVYASIAGHSIWQESFHPFLLAWIGREALAFPIWILAIFGDEVVWRGRKYQVLHNGEARLTT